MNTINDTTIREMLQRATYQLEGGSVINSKGEAQRIISSSLNIALDEMYLQTSRKLTSEEIQQIEKIVSERLEGFPLQYVLGYEHFRNLTLKCTDDVLIPRPETELLVELAVAELKLNSASCLVLDIGCGTGAIALSVADEYPLAHVYASDVSESAVKLAAENAVALGYQEQVRVIKSDLFEAFEEFKNKFNVIISNPPYVRTGDIEWLQKEVKREPTVALDGGSDGLAFYRAIVGQAPDYLAPNGILLFEVGYGQADAVADIIRKCDCFADIDIFKDYQDIERVVRARKV